jgi:hypothetical protein
VRVSRASALNAREEENHAARKRVNLIHVARAILVRVSRASAVNAREEENDVKRGWIVVLASAKTRERKGMASANDTDSPKIK